jgi:hypothetical protein
MALSNNYPLYQDTLCTTTNSIASTPLACAIRAPYRGTIDRIGAVSHGAFTTDCSIAVAIITSPVAGVAPGSGTAVGGSPMTLDDTNSAAGTQTSMVPTGANVVAEGDIIVFTPSGSTGTTIGATFTVSFSKAG